MKIKKANAIITILGLLAVSTPTVAHAESLKVIQPSEVHKSPSILREAPISPTDFRDISNRNLIFAYAGVKCRFESIEGCKVIQSTIASIPVGSLFRASISHSKKFRMSNSAFNARCNWCAITGDFMAITVYVVFAAGASPVAVGVATYTVGLGIILGHV